VRATAKQRQAPAARPDWDPRYDRAVQALLDYLARELAEEYVRLMKQAKLRGEDSHESGDLCPVQFGKPAS
jgi:hypothetical protein